jgi:diguanylate cyclase (GGDEF)-like protein/PAS domain S-box-containing protein
MTALVAELLEAELACVARRSGSELVAEVVHGRVEASDPRVAEVLSRCLPLPHRDEVRVEELPGEPPHALLAVPLQRGGETVEGVLCLLGRAGRSWSRQEVEWLRTVAGGVAAELGLRREVEERERLRAALSRSVALYREMVETASDLIYRTDREGRFTYANPATARALGYPEAELLRMTVAEVTRADFRERQIRQHRRQMEEGVTQYTELPLVRQDGSQLWIGQNVQPLHDNGAIGGVQAVARDITDQRAIEQALRDSEERFRNVVENLGEGLVITDLEDRILYVNPRLTELTGHSPQDLIGEVAHRVLFPEAEWSRGEAELEVRLRGVSSRYEVEHVRRDGERRWLEINAVPYRSPDGEIVGTLALVQDIEERRASQEALRSSEARFRAIFDGAAFGIAMMDPAGRIVEVNHSIERKFDLEARQLRGSSFHDIVHPDDRAEHLRLWEELLAGEGQHNLVEQRLVRRDEPPIWVRVGYSLVRDATGEPQYVIVVGSEVTRQRERDLALRESEERFRLMVEGSEQVFFYVHDVEHRFEYLSPSVASVLGYDPEELLGESYDVLLTGDTSDPEVHALTDGALQAGRGFCTYTVITRHKDGRIVPIEVIESPLLREGEVVGMQGFARDITQRQQAREALERSEEYFRSLTENAHDVIHVVNADGTTRYVSPSVERLLGYGSAELVGRPAAELVHGDDLAAILQEIRTGRGDGAARPLEFRAIHREGGVRYFEGVIRNLLDDPVVSGVVINSREISERRRAQEEVMRLAALSRENPNPVLQCDASGSPVHVNPAAEHLTQELGLAGVRDLLPENHEQLVRAILTDGHEFQSVEVSVADRIFAWSYRPQPETGAVFLFAVDITSRRLMEEQLRHDALHDALTGLPNRLLFLERLAHAILRSKRRERYLFAVLFLDLDRFKVINDSLGHHVGDELLVVIARRLQGCLRPEDSVARLGGDEFAVLLEDLGGVSDATRVAERIQAELSRSVTLSGFDVFTSASIGIALSSTTYERPEYLLRNADMAMYRAKAAGHARFEVFDRAMHAQALTRLQLETDLRRAVENEELELFYQPVVDLRDGRLTGFEALLRWNHPDRGLMPPDEFIPIAEETGVILALGNWVMTRAAGQLREWRERFPDHAGLSVGVNLSPKQLSQPDLVEQVQRAMTDAELPPGTLRIEITESAVMENAETARVLLERLKEIGVEIVLDDFGTGYSSLSHLHRFPLDSLKIDRSFVGRMTGEERSRQLVHTILLLSRSLGVTAVAEGIETPEQLDLLRAIGCDFAQGFLFSRPMPVREVEAMLANGNPW